MDANELALLRQRVEKLEQLVRQLLKAQHIKESPRQKFAKKEK